MWHKYINEMEHTKNKKAHNEKEHLSQNLRNTIKKILRRFRIIIMRFIIGNNNSLGSLFFFYQHEASTYYKTKTKDKLNPHH